MVVGGDGARRGGYAHTSSRIAHDAHSGWALLDLRGNGIGAEGAGRLAGMQGVLLEYEFV